MVKTEEKHEAWWALKRSAVVAVVAIMVLATFSAFEAGQLTAPTYTVTVGEVYIPTTVTKSLFNVSTFTFSEYVARTTTDTSFVTVNANLPQFVDLSGTAKSNGIGTTATNIQFVAVDGTESTGAVNAGAYSVHVKNQQNFNIYIQYSGTAGVGGGRCLAGAFVLYSPDQNMTGVNWAC